MKRVCAWCGKNLGDSEQGSFTVTHGICKSCGQGLLREMGRPLGKFLDGLGAPVVMVDANALVLTANSQAREMLQKDLPAIRDCLGGEVFDCIHSFEEGGCGRTAHCAACAVRLSVMQTFETGEGVEGAKAYLDIKTGNGTVRKWFFVYTEPMAGVVLLKVLEAPPDK